MSDESIFAVALAIANPSERSAYLDQACAGRPGLRKEVEELLAAHAADNPLDRAPADLGATGGFPSSETADLPNAQPGDRIGPYKLMEQIGEGGMGTVWMAQQSEPVKRVVAIKLIKAGMDSKAVLARFEAERQALAIMDHPNIAKVLEAGTTTGGPGGVSAGRPYFVMELVKGIPITQFCDQRKLTPKQRLELFLPVCHAIQHAHQKGIIHRDIKPSNVLIALYDDKPVPKVIDFGVAKATGQTLTDKTLMTGFGAVVGTPEYMSPEQASFNQLDVDTRSDVYALGVLLYELLTGSPPFSKKELDKIGMLEILRVIREQEPSKPSAKLSTAQALPSIAANRSTEPKKLTGILRGELDWIVMKALEKDRTRRYESANGFAADVQRYLAGEQVQAVPPSVGYLLRKFVRKNRGPVIAATIVLLVLTVGIIGTVWGLFEARNQRDQAEKARGLEAEQRKIALEAVEAEGNAKNEEKNRANEAVEAKAAALQSLYDARILTLRDAWENGNVPQARALLEAMRPGPGERDPRGFEWHYLDRQIEGVRSVVVNPTIDGIRMYALPEVLDGGRVLLFRQTAPNGIYFDARSYDTATGRLVEGFKPIQGKYRARNSFISSTLLAFSYRRGEPGTQFLHYHISSPPPDRIWETTRPADLSVYDARSGVKVADVPDLVVEPEAIQQGWQLTWPFAKLEHWFHLERSLRASVLVRAITPKTPSDPDTESHLQVHDMKTGRVIASMEPRPGKILDVRFSNDGQHVLTIHHNNRERTPGTSVNSPEYASELSVWNVASQKRLWSYRSSQGTVHVEFRDSGREVYLTVSQVTPESAASGTTPLNKTLRFDAMTGNQLPPRTDRFAPGDVYGYQLVTTSVDGNWVAVVNRNRVDLRDAVSGILWRTFRTEQPIHAAHFVDGDRTLRVIESLAAYGVRCSSLDVPIRPKAALADAPPKGDSIRRSTHQLVNKVGRAWSFQISMAGTPGNNSTDKEKREPSDWTFRLQDIGTGNVREIAVRADLGRFFEVASHKPVMSEDGRLIAITAHPAPETGEAKEPSDGQQQTGFAVLDFNERKLRFIRKHPTAFEEIIPRFSPNGKLIAYTHGKRLYVCDTVTDQEIWSVDANKFTGISSGTIVEFSRDGRQLAVGAGEVKFFNAENGNLDHTIPATDQFSPKLRSSSHMTKGFWSNDGQKFVRLAVGQMRIWEVATWTELARVDLLKEGELPNLIVPSPDHQHVAVGCKTAISEESRFQVYSVATGRPCLEESETARPVTLAVFSQDSRRLFLIFAPEQQSRGNSREQIRTVRVVVCDYQRDLQSLAIETPIPEGNPILRFDVSGNKLLLGFGVGESFTIDASPRTSAEVTFTRRLPRSELEFPDVRVGPVIMTRPNGDLHSKYPIAIALYTKDPKTASNHADVAVSAHGEPAVKAWREAIRLDPQFAALHHELALAFKASNKPVEAIAAFRDCLKIDPERAESLYQLGSLLFQQGKPQEAITPLREAVRLQPQHANAFNDLGCCLRDTNNIAEAINAFESAVKLNKAFENRFPSIAVGIPNFALPHRNLGELFSRQREFDRSAAAFKEAIRFAQYDASLHDWYGYALRESGDLVAAEKEFREAIRFNVMNNWFFTNLGICLIRQGKLKELEQEVNKRLKQFEDQASTDVKNPEVIREHAQAMLDIGAMYLWATHYAEANAWCERATKRFTEYYQRMPAIMEAEKQTRHTHWHRAVALNWLDRPADAIAQMNLFLKMAPEADQVYQKMMRARYVAKTGDHKAAAKTVTELLALPKPSPNYWDAALAYALCSQAVKGDDKLRTAYADVAIALLKKALDAGFDNLDLIKKDPDLNPVRDRADCKMLVAELEKKLPPKRELAPPPREVKQ